MLKLELFPIRDYSNITKALLDWVGGFKNWPFLLTNSTERVSGLENLSKHAYVWLFIFDFTSTSM
jgi:hypothetical protein